MGYGKSHKRPMVCRNDGVGVMISKERLAELRKHWAGFPSRLNGNITGVDMVDMFDTIESLLRENERLSGKTGSCTQCEAYARELSAEKQGRKERNARIEQLERVAAAAESVIRDVIPCTQWNDQRLCHKSCWRCNLSEALQALRGKP